MVIAFEVTWQQISTTPICRRQAGFLFRQKGMGWVEGGVRVSQQPPNRPESPSLASMLHSQGLARFSKQHTKELYLYSFFKKIECANWFRQDFSSSATICVLFFFWVCVNVLSFLPLLTYIPHLRFPPSLFLPAKTHRSRSYFFLEPPWLIDGILPGPISLGNGGSSKLKHQTVHICCLASSHI